MATLLSFHPVLAILRSVFGHFMFLSGRLLDYPNRSTWSTRVNDPLSLATDSGYVFFFIILYIKKNYLDLEKILSSGGDNVFS